MRKNTKLVSENKEQNMFYAKQSKTNFISEIYQVSFVIFAFKKNTCFKTALIQESGMILKGQSPKNQCVIYSQKQWIKALCYQDKPIIVV